MRRLAAWSLSVVAACGGAPTAPVSPPTAPAGPASLTATGAGATISLSWPAAPGATAYLVLRGTAAGAESGTALATLATTSYDDTGLAAGVTYFYIVKAQNSAGLGGASPEASAVTAPPAPASLTATGGTASVALGWPASAGATSYAVRRGTAAGAESATAIATTAANSYTDSGRAPGTTYYYVVSAQNASGSSAASPEAKDTTAPAAPANVIATGGAQSIALSWDASAGTSTYQVFRGTSPGAEGATAIATQAGTSFPDISLPDGITYYYVVTAQNSAGNAASSEASAPTLPAAPLGVSATVDDKAARISWTATTGATAYEIDYSTASNGPYTSIFPSPGTQTSATVTPLVNGTPYFFVVRARDAAGLGPQSGKVSATPAPVLASPTLSGSADSTQAILSWNAVTGATGYKLSRSLTANGPYAQVFLTASAITYTDTGLTNGTTYHYVVQTQNSAGLSPNSNELALTPQPPLVAPVVTAVPGNGKVTLSWGTVAGATGYEIARATSPSPPGALFTVAASTVTTSFVDSTTTNQTTYYFKVRAKNASSPGGPASAEIKAVPAVEICVASDSAYVYALAADAPVDGEQDARRTFGGGTMIFSPSAVAADATNGELLVANETAASVTVYPLNHGSTLDVPPLRLLAGGATLLHNPQAMAVDATANLLLVWDATPTSTDAGTILIFARGASGNTAPLKTIAVAASNCATPTPQPGALAVQPGIEFYFSCGGATLYWALPVPANNAPPAGTVAGNPVGQTIKSLAWDGTALIAGTDNNNAAGAHLLVLSPRGTNNPLLQINSPSLTNVVGVASDGTKLAAIEQGTKIFFFDRAAASTTGATATATGPIANGPDTTGISWDSANGKFWVVERTYNAVSSVKAATTVASGEISAPISRALLQGTGLVADPAANTLWVGDHDSTSGSGKSVVEGYPLFDFIVADSASKRIPASGPSSLNSIGQLALDAVNHELYVADFAGTVAQPGMVTVWNATAPGTTPLRSVPATPPTPAAFGLAFDGAELFVGVGSTATDSAVNRYSRALNGTLIFSNQLAGAATKIVNPGGVWVGTKIVVANGDNSILEFPRGATGNVAPNRIIVPALSAGESLVSVIADGAGNLFASVGILPFPNRGSPANPARFRVLEFDATTPTPGKQVRSLSVRGSTGGASGLAFCN